MGLLEAGQLVRVSKVMQKEPVDMSLRHLLEQVGPLILKVAVAQEGLLRVNLGQNSLIFILKSRF